ncbi:MAG TPA: STAS domain-containing protein [Bacteroidales bacterium]
MKNKTLEIIKSNKGEPVKAILYVDDELSFINASLVKDEISNKVKEFDQLLIQANIVHLDLTGVQLLYSIRKSCETLNKQVTFNIKMNDELKNLISRAGFNDLFN